MTTPRCDDVAHALSAGVDPSRPDLAGHLVGCSRCAAWLETVAAIDSAWAATRPVEPSDDVFDRIWSGVETRRAVLPMRTGFARLPYRTLAAAASVLIGVGLGWRVLSGGFGDAPDRGVAQTPAPPVLTPVSFEAEPGQTLYLQIAPNGRIQAANRAPTETSDTVTVAAEFEILNFIESQAPDAL